MLSTDLAGLKAHMAENPGAVIEDVAREQKVSPRAVLEALPESMVRLGPGSEFGAAMNDVAQWGEVTLIVHTDDAIFEFRRRPAVAIIAFPAFDLARFLCRNLGDRGGCIRHRAEHVFIENADTAGSDRAHGEFGVPRNAELADDEGGERRVKGPRHLVGHGDAAARQG